MSNYDEKENYVGYYIFVFVSAIIGFILLFFSTRAAITYSATKGVLDLTPGKTLYSVIVSLVGVIIFLFLTLIFKKFFKKILLSEMFLYLYMGFITTAINVIAFQFFLKIFSKNTGAEGLGWKIAEVLAFIVALIFAFLSNKIFVFKSYSFAGSKFILEFVQFSLARLVTEVINFLMMWIMIDLNDMNEMFTKILAAIIVIVLNYIFSKFIIFKKK